MSAQGVSGSGGGPFFAAFRREGALHHFTETRAVPGASKLENTLGAVKPWPRKDSAAGCDLAASLLSCAGLSRLAVARHARGLWCPTKCWCLYLKKSDPQSQPMGVHLHSASSAPPASPCPSLLLVKIPPRHPGSFCFPCVGKLLSLFHTSAHSNG